MFSKSLDMEWVEVFIESVARSLLDFAQIERERKLRIDARGADRQGAWRMTEAKKAFETATLGLECVDGKDGIVASARVHDMVLAAAEAAFHPVIDDIKSERRVHADRRMES